MKRFLIFQVVRADWINQMKLSDRIDTKLKELVSSRIAQVDSIALNSWPLLKSINSFELLNHQVADPNEIQHILQLFHSNTDLVWDRRKIRLLCSGIRSSLNTPGDWVLRFGAITQSPEMSSSAWFQITSAYWDADLDDATVNGNWYKLGVLLKTHLLTWLKENSRTAWQKELSKHPDLFESSAPLEFCINNNSLHKDGLEKLFKQIGAGTNSWLHASLILGGIKAITDQSDSEFTTKLPAALSKIEACLAKHPIIGNQSLVMVADRYQQGHGLGNHDQLRSVTIKAWGNPRFDTSDVAWSRVKSETKQMVKGWLSEWDLEQFFSLLDANGAAHKERLQFWRGYMHLMSATQMVLGPDAANNSQSDYVKLRSHLKNENRLWLLQSNAKNNNAFIFEINGYQFVEFSLHGQGAFYIFKDGQFPVQLNRQGNSIVLESNLKNQVTCFKRLTHGSNWQSKFSQELRGLGIYSRIATGLPKNVPLVVTNNPPIHRAPTTNPESRTNYFRLPVAESQLMPLLLSRFGESAVHDNRQRGGYLTIVRNSIDQDWHGALLQVGFMFAPQKGYWRL